MRGLVCGYLIALLGISGAALAVDEQANPDPMQAAMSHARLMEAGDFAGARKLAVKASWGQDTEILATAVKLAAACRQLEDAAVARYGPAGRGMAEPVAYLPSTMADSRYKRIVRDYARVGWKDQAMGLELRLIEDQWRPVFPHDEFAGDLHACQELVSLATVAAADIQSRKYHAAPEAKREIHAALWKAIDAAATHPHPGKYLTQPPADWAVTADTIYLGLYFDRPDANGDEHVVAVVLGRSYDLSVKEHREALGATLGAFVERHRGAGTKAAEVKVVIQPNSIINAGFIQAAEQACSTAGVRNVQSLPKGPPPKVRKIDSKGPQLIGGS